MGQIEKTAFLSNRRANIPWALTILQNLKRHGYDVFTDHKGIASGSFERVILDNISSRAHFLVLRTASALNRCADPGDWFRREIETAIDLQRNIVPIFLEPKLQRTYRACRLLRRSYGASSQVVF